MTSLNNREEKCYFYGYSDNVIPLRPHHGRWEEMWERGRREERERRKEGWRKVTKGGGKNE